MHHILQKLANKAWREVRAGKPNPLIELAAAESAFLEIMDESGLRDALNIKTYLGDAPLRAERFADQILKELQ